MKILQKIAKKRQKTNFLIFFVRILNKAVGRIFASISKLFQFWKVQKYLNCQSESCICTCKNDFPAQYGWFKSWNENFVKKLLRVKRWKNSNTKKCEKNISPREGLSYRTAQDFDDDFFRVSNKGRKYLFSKTFFFFRICLDFNIRFYFSCVIVFGLHYITYSQHSILRSCFEHQFL